MIFFETSAWENSLVFKGGTSLSKVYGLIDRFWNIPSKIHGQQPAIPKKVSL
ncbi:MAG: nucleotidyl transferase AbiEii/AbiGii toxin family protein [Spirochaetales bacterium]|nr:nucleotidyl transferase AbiEii/AbiGii toxin family protein [Spirochaetales bacterium]